jgi:hypothetical protein
VQNIAEAIAIKTVANPNGSLEKELNNSLDFLKFIEDHEHLAQHDPKLTRDLARVMKNSAFMQDPGQLTHCKTPQLRRTTPRTENADAYYISTVSPHSGIKIGSTERVCDYFGDRRELAHRAPCHRVIRSHIRTV